MGMNKDMRKTTIYLPEKLDREMRIAAATVGSSYSEVAIEAFQDYIDKRKKK